MKKNYFNKFVMTMTSKKKKISPAVFAVIPAALVLVGAILVTMFLLKKKKSKDESNELPDIEDPNNYSKEEKTNSKLIKYDNKQDSSDADLNFWL